MRLGKWKIGQRKSAGYERQRGEREQTTWRDVERSLRRRMRIYPSKIRDRAPAEEATDDRGLGQLDIRLPAGGRGAAGWRNPEVNRDQRKAIISILDVDEQEAIIR